MAHEDRCQNCGEHVSEAFRRVFGDNDNVVHSCQECGTNSEHFHGSAADPDADVPMVIQ